MKRQLVISGLSILVILMISGLIQIQSSENPIQIPATMWPGISIVAFMIVFILVILISKNTRWHR